MEIENEIEYFRAWLKDCVKDRKVVTGKYLADKLGTSPQRISHFHSGRTDNGVKTFPKISIKERREITKIIGVEYDTAIETGKKIINKTIHPTSEIEERLAKIEATLPLFSMQANATVDITTERHRKVIDKFQNKDLALKLNELLLEIEQMDPDALKEAETTLSLLKIKLEQEALKKRPAANEKD